MFWILQITPYPAQEETAKKIPGEALNPIGWIEKMFPILWLIVGLKLTPNASMAFKISLKLILPVSILFIWPLAALLSFVNIRNFLLFAIPKTTAFEIVAAFTTLALFVSAIYGVWQVIAQIIPLV